MSADESADDKHSFLADHGRNNLPFTLPEMQEHHEI